MNEGDQERLLELVHPDVEATVKARPGEVLRGRRAVAEFLGQVAAQRTVYEEVVSEVQALDDRRVIVVGRTRWMDDERVLRDDPVVWALEFQDGLLRRSTPTRSLTEAEALLSTSRPAGQED